jgi:hypothetical protein
VTPEPAGLRWAIKPSFVDYVARTRDGRAYLSGGATANESNELLFELEDHASPEADDGADHAFTFRGDVRFQAHLGMLYVRIAEPRVILRDGEGELTVIDSESAAGGRVRLVTFSVTGPEISDGVQRWDAEGVRLDVEGVPLFGETYEAGEPFAPLTITVPAERQP